MHLSLRKPWLADGSRMWAVIRESGGLDLNSPYCYLMFADAFASTCVVAESANRIAGVVIGYRKPADPDCLFVWQVGVAPDFRGRGVARAMLDHLADRTSARRLEASVGPSNAASRALFASFARSRNANLHVTSWMSPSHFPKAGHEAEELLHIGPLLGAEVLGV